jgi:hypothetical protein
MSATTNPDRVYVNRQYRAKIRLDQEETALFGPSTTGTQVALPSIGATLIDISAGGCCLRLTRCELPFDISSDSYISSIKLLHPELDSTPIQGRIAWSRVAPPHMLMGIQFTRIRPATLASIQVYLEATRTK